MSRRRTRILILGAAGRDFHNFNMAFRGNADYEVVAFTATQIPRIEGRVYPPELAGPLYPSGIEVLPEGDMEKIIASRHVDRVVFAYSDVSHETVMHLASRAGAAGADFWLLGSTVTQIRSSKPVIAVCAARTGCGKSQTSRKVAMLLRDAGVRVSVVRHPMPYGDLVKQKVQRFASYEDLKVQKCTIEEIEEYEQYVERGMTIFAGVDYEAIVRTAEQECDILIWDGGNNDTPFVKPDLHIAVLDPLRPGHELKYYPGEVNLRAADLVIVNKMDRAEPSALDTVLRNIKEANPTAEVLLAESLISLQDPGAVKGKRVLVVEDGPTLTHGGMSYGAGFVAAQRFGAKEIVDPRPYASGDLANAYMAFPHMDRILPALGYYPEQLASLERTIDSVPCDAVIIGTPVDLRRYVKLSKPAVRVTYELSEKAGQRTLSDVVSRFLADRS